MEVESKKIKLSGKEYLFRANFRCLLEFEKISGKSVNEIESLNDSTMFVYCGIKAGMIHAKKPYKLTYDEFVDTLDNFDVLEVLGTAATESETPKKKIKEK